jgi:hypothetical protein
MKYLPHGLFVAALGLAYAYSHTAAPHLKQLEAGYFALLLGASGILWGRNELRSGRTLVVNRAVGRSENPVVFWIVIVIFRFAIGLIMLAAGLRKLGGRSALLRSRRC